MYHLFKGIYANITKREEYCVLILGLDNAGKTTLLERLKSDYSLNSDGRGVDVSRIAPTVGQNVARVQINGVWLKVWDVGGQESLRTLWDSYYNEVHGVVFVVDSTDRARIEECRDALDKVISNELIEGAPVLMLANKQDQEERLEVEDIKEIFNKMAEKMSARDSRVLPISALEGTGVSDAAQWLVTRLVRNKEARPPQYR
jgi:ADP-ribosylation factor related protein 1